MRLLLAAPADTLCRILLISFWIVLHLSLSDGPSLPLLLSFLTSGPDLGAWPNYWVFVEFLCALIPRKGSGSTTTTNPRSTDYEADALTTKVTIDHVPVFQ